MGKIILVPQYPTKMRYQEFFLSELEECFSYYAPVHVLGKTFINNDVELYNLNGMFSPIDLSIRLELQQAKEYMSMTVYPDDILFICDLSFPGIFSNLLYHKKPKKCYAYCHATSLNKYDYFSKNRKSKFKVEKGHSELFDKIFVGSNYHKNILDWKNVVNIGLPIPPYKTFNEKKKYDIISISRPCIQKVNKKIEKLVERDFGKIERKQCDTWEEYYKFLSSAKVVLFTGKEDTFGYGIMESLMNNSNAVAPFDCAYPELLNDEYLYIKNDYEHLRQVIWSALNDKTPKQENVKCWNTCENFYNNLRKEMNLCIPSWIR